MSLWQTHDWQHMLQKSGQVEAFFEVEDIFVEKRRVSFGKLGLFVIGVDTDLSKDTIAKIQILAKQEKCLFVQFETITYDGKNITIPDISPGHYKKFIPSYTCLIDLTKTQEEILAGMKQKGRYNIRLAEKKGVTIEQVEKNPYNIEQFFKLVSDTTIRNEFSGNTQQYYEIFLKALRESQLFFAYYEDVVIAAGVFTYSGNTAIYYYGASSNEHRNLMAPYLLQWKVIEHAKSREYHYYDFLGVAGPDDIHSGLKGVTDFKMKLSQDRRQVSYSYIWINNKFLYTIIRIMRKIFKK